MPAGRRPRDQSIPTLIGALVSVTVLGGLIADRLGWHLGTALPPFFASWEPSLAWAALPVAVLLGASATAAPKLLSPKLRPVLFGAATFGLSLALMLALALGRGGGPAVWHAVFGTAPEASNEYLPALPAVHALGLKAFLDRFAEIAPTLPIHPSAHPPGLLVLIDALGIRSATQLATLTIGSAALVAPVVYLLGRALMDEQGARAAALLFVFSPAALIYGATSADALYALLGTAAAATLIAPRPMIRLLGPVLLAFASFFSYALLGVGAWAVAVVCQREGLRRAVLLTTVCGLALASLYGALFAATGFDPVGAMGSAHFAYTHGIANVRPYSFWVLGSPTAFLVALGLPIAWYALRALTRRDPAAVALAIIVASASLLGFTKGETERIWLFMVPFACVAAARLLPAQRLAPVLGVLAAQALAVELLFGTVW